MSLHKPIMVSLLLGLAVGCSDECECPLGALCDATGACVFECSADADCPTLTCAEDDLCCSERALCVGHECVREEVPEGQCGPAPAVSEGWDGAVGSGDTYVVETLELTSACAGSAPCVNGFEPLTEFMNDWFRVEILGHLIRMVVELRGRDDLQSRFDRSVTVVFYDGWDADDPATYLNDFAPFEGLPECCQFKPNPFTTNPDAPWSFRAAGQVRQGRLRLTETASVVELPFSFDSRVGEGVLLHDMEIEGRLGPDGRLAELTLWGRLWPEDLWAVTPYCENPDGDRFCPAGESSLHFVEFLAWHGVRPDVDRDGEGLVCFLDTNGDGPVDRCCANECGPSCPQIPPVDEAEPGSCSVRAEAQDAYSLGLRAHLVPAVFSAAR